MSIHHYMTKYGWVNHSDICKDDWGNIVISPKWKKPNGTVVDRNEPLKLQRSAVRSIRAVEKKIGEQVVVTGTWRSCSEQYTLWRSDSTRYASPNVTLHTQGLAIDVNMDYLNDKMRVALLNHGWYQARPTDEPWHFSFRLNA